MIALILIAAAAVAVLSASSGGPVQGSEPGEYFTWRELTTTSQVGDNTPTPSARKRLRDLVQSVLDPFRRHVGVPVRITSGYRSPAINAAIGGSNTSQHMRGEAVDLTIAGRSSREIARAVLASGVPYDQLIWYTDSPHVHVSYRAGSNRGQVLSASREGGTYYSEDP